MDRRTARTKESIQLAYLGLLDECDTGEIKIAALCREAKINRSTFYRYYPDCCSVLEEIEERLMTEVEALALGWVKEQGISRVSRVLHPALIRLYPDLDETRRKWRLSYILSGCMGLISRWIREGMQESPEEVARELTALTEQNAGLGQRGVCCRGQGPGSRK